jgi:hypothetical protein
MIGAGDREMARLLRFIAKGDAAVGETQDGGRIMLESGAHGTISTAPDSLQRALNQGLARLSKGRAFINPEGRACCGAWSGLTIPMPVSTGAMH